MYQTITDNHELNKLFINNPLVPYPEGKTPPLSVEKIFKTLRNNAGFLSKLISLLFLGVVYLPALLYRFNIKANFWLWGLVAWTFNPKLWVNREGIAALTTWVLISLYSSIALTYGSWLLWPHLPLDIQSLMPSWLGVVQGYLPTPQLSLRFLVLLVCLLCFGILIYKSYRMRAAHPKPLDGADDYKILEDDDKKIFEIRAQQVYRWLRINICFAVLAIWVFVLHLSADGALQPIFKLAVWDWLKPYL